MLAADRHLIILRAITEYGSVKTAEIAKELGVSDETVRKDFESLEARSLIVRSHGGATQPKRNIPELTLTERQLINPEAKKKIAKAAIKRIQLNEIVFIDASSTALTLTQFLPDFRFTVITNAHDVITALSSFSNIDVISTGGVFEPRSRSFIGLSAEKTLRRYHIHRMFFSGNGIDIERGISERNSRQGGFKEHVIAAADDICFLADETKIGVQSSFFFARCNQITTLITTKAADATIVQKLQKMGIETICA